MHKKNLEKEIHKRVAKDQSARTKWVKNPTNKHYASVVQERDAQNTKFVENVLEKYGWPGFDRVGEKASHNFWLLVQHADHDLELQERALELLKQAASKGRASKADQAYLTDRILVSKGRKQLYGTQFVIKNKKAVLYPTKYKKTLEKRRKRMGLDTIAESRQRLRERYKNILE